MALSNWDTLAFNLNGPCSGHVTNTDGWRIEIYKNWLYVHHNDLLITTVQEGHLYIGQWQILARRGPQEGVYVVAWSSQINRQGEAVDKALIVGCGVYGFTDPADDYADLIAELGIDRATVGTMYPSGHEEGVLVAIADGKQVVLAEKCKPAEFVGVQPASVQYLRDMTDEVIKENTVVGTKYWPAPELAAIDWDHALRANQGDLYFETNAGTQLTGTAPGEADTPVLLQALQPDKNTDSSQ